jgi:hypothetical protein
MPVGAGIALVGAYAASEQADAAGDASRSAQQGAARGQQQYEEYNRPFYNAGTSALSRLERLNAGDFSDFTASPDYQFTQQQGIEGLNRAASSRGSLNSGGQDVDLLRFGQGLASQNYGQYYSRLANLAQMGQQTAQGLGGQAVNAQNQIGQAQGDAAIGQANAWGNFASGIGGLAGQYQGQGAFGAGRQSSFQQPQIGPVTRNQFQIPQYNIGTGGYN